MLARMVAAAFTLCPSWLVASEAAPPTGALVLPRPAVEIVKGKSAMLSLTTGGPAAAYEKGGFNGDINAILRPAHRGILQFTGFEVLAPQIVYGPVRLEQEQRAQLLAAYAGRLKGIWSEQPFDVGIY